jgi:FAD/FMN-containing dehydrogenase
MKTTLIPLSLAYLAQCQVTSPEAPKAVVTDWAKQVKANADSLPCERACAAIAEAVPQTFYLRDEGDFRLWDEKQRELTPACRIEPATPADVSVIVKAAAADNCHFAVRSGGHSRIAGSSNAEGGITIDLRRFDQVEVSKDKKTVKIGGGNTWGPVYRALEKDNLAVVGGRVSDVGVGGLLLGGRYWLHPRKN